MLDVNDVVQFNEKHKWVGCIGIVHEIKNDRIMVLITIPERGNAYIFTTIDNLEYIGHAVLVPKEDE